jgi:hypothetical protein
MTRESSDENPFRDNPYATSQTQVPYERSAADGDAVSGLIPYKNPPALIAYYLGLISLFPCLGILFAIPALVLGIMGLRKRAENPEVKGSVHAWIGIVLGGLFTLIWGVAWVLFIIGLFAQSQGWR